MLLHDPTPVPLKATDCGLSSPVLNTNNVAFLAPVPAGENVTLILQLAPGADDELQLLVSVKSPEKLPVIAMFVIFRVTGPLFVIFTTCAALLVQIVCDPNPSLVGEKFVGPATLIEAGAVRVAKEPVPVTVTIYGPGAIERLAVIVSVEDPPEELM